MSYGTLCEERRYGRKAIPVYDNHTMPGSTIGLYDDDFPYHVVRRSMKLMLIYGEWTFGNPIVILLCWFMHTP